jgi:hypothetical protein
MELNVEKVVKDLMMDENGIFLKSMAIVNRLMSYILVRIPKVRYYHTMEIAMPKDKLDKLGFMVGLIAKTQGVILIYNIKKIRNSDCHLLTFDYFVTDDVKDDVKDEENPK